MLITKDQVLELHTYMEKEHQKVIKTMFPSVFRWAGKFEIGQVYKESTALGNGHRFLFVTEVNPESVEGYGVDGSGNWFNKGGYVHGDFELASDTEWMRQLELQAIKKGYKIGTRFETIDYGDSKIVEIASEDLSTSKKDIHLRTTEASLLYRDIYSNGIWAEIEESITLKQAEARLGVKIKG